MQRFALIAAALSAAMLAGACATVTTEQTEPLLTTATELRATLRTETTAVDAAVASISSIADAICAEPDDYPEASQICPIWTKPAATEGANAPGDGSGRGTRPQAGAANDVPTRSELSRASTLVSTADAGMAEVVGYINALHQLAESGEKSAAASSAIITRLEALGGLLGGEGGPLDVVFSSGFGPAVRLIAEAQTARQVNGTMLAATSEAQLMLDLYALAMRDALGACSVRVPDALKTRVARYAEALSVPDSRLAPNLPASEQAQLRRSLAQALRWDDTACSAAIYPTVIDRAHRVTTLLLRNKPGSDYAMITAFERVSPELSERQAAIFRRLSVDLEAFSGDELSDEDEQSVREAAAELERLSELQERLEPYRDDAEAYRAALAEADEWRRQRLANRIKLARSFIALAQTHAGFREGVRTNRKIQLPRLGEVLAGPASSDEGE